MFLVKTSLRTGAAACALALSFSIATQAHAQSRIYVAPASLEDALNDLSRQAGVAILSNPALLRGKRGGAVKGADNVEAGLNQILRGTGLGFEKRGQTFLIVRTTRPLPPPRSTPPTPLTSAEQAGDNHPSGEPGQQIVVTGTRISRPDLESAMPVSVVNIEQAQRFGRVTAYDALLREPAISAGIGPLSSSGASWDAGISAVSLRNLGAARSLTLIDGMRRVSGSAQSSAVDLGMIPGGMIERIEIVTGGAAAIYGADAVTGAVNVITRRDFKGLEFTAQNGVSDYGDMNRITVSGVGGGSFDDGRGSFIMGATYTSSPELAAADRPFARNFSTVQVNPDDTGPNDGIPDQLLARNYANIYISPVPTFFYKDKSYLYQDDTLITGYYDQEYRSGEFSGGTGGTVYPNNSTRNGMIAQKLNSFAAIARLNYDITDNIEFTARVDYGQTKSIKRSETYRDDSRTVWMDGAGGAVAYLDNPYLPGPIRQFMVANGLKRLNINRVYANLPRKQETHDRQTINLFGGLNGTFTGSSKWSLFYQYGRSRDDVEAINYPYRSHWLAARDAIADPVTGLPVCRDAAARAAGCIPFDIFSTKPVSAAQLAYITGGRLETRTNTQQIVGGNLTSNAFELLYGAISYSIGAEHRRESLVTSETAGVLGTELIGAGRLDPHPELDASFNVSEVYGEVVVPLLRNLPFAYRLEVEGAYRYSDYNTFGSTDTWKVGGTWSPIRGITLRGVRSRSVRAPNFGELYNPQTIGTTGSVRDPCGQGRYAATPTRAANCAALGITTPLPSVYPDAIIVISGGNQDLAPEISNSLTLGTIFQPEFLPGFSLTADYWDIDIENVITQYSLINTLNLCVDLPSIDNPLCRNITRAADGKVTRVFANQLNAARQSARGIDFGMQYLHEVGAGTLGLTFKGTYLLERMIETTPGIPEGDVAYDGGYTDPRFKGFLTVSYDIGPFSAAVDTRFISASLLYPDQKGTEFVDFNRIPARVYNDVSIQYEVTPKVRLGLGVNNILNVKPPEFPGLETGADGRYDAIGRYFFATLRARI